MRDIRLTLSLDSDILSHARIIKAIISMPRGKRTEYAVNLMLQALDLQSFIHDAVKQAVMECAPRVEAPAPRQPAPAADISDGMLDFIFALQASDEGEL